MVPAQALVLLPLQVKLKVHICQGSTVGTFACPGNGSTGTKLAKKAATLHYGRKLKEPQPKDSTAGILVPQKASFYIGMAVVWLNVLIL